MNDEQKKMLIAWLNDAHAMEEGLMQVLEKQVSETAEMPEMQGRIKTHLEETKRHAELVRSCLARYDTEPSGAKDLLAKVTSAMNGFGMSLTSDAMVKNVHSSYAAEHFEIASYLVIRAAAAKLKDTETVTVCDAIISEEEAMAAWLHDQIASAVAECLDEVAEA
jgi:ferritin-like metal-binding protein YciE